MRGGNWGEHIARFAQAAGVGRSLGRAGLEAVYRKQRAGDFHAQTIFPESEFARRHRAGAEFCENSLGNCRDSSGNRVLVSFALVVGLQFDSQPPAGMDQSADIDRRADWDLSWDFDHAICSRATDGLGSGVSRISLAAPGCRARDALSRSPLAADVIA